MRKAVVYLSIVDERPIATLFLVLKRRVQELKRSIASALPTDKQAFLFILRLPLLCIPHDDDFELSQQLHRHEASEGSDEICAILGIFNVISERVEDDGDAFQLRHLRDPVRQPFFEQTQFRLQPVEMVRPCSDVNVQE
jgi:hypothetical protein